jgi:branched-chain amino acid transport system ATP-binding protein
MGDLVPTATLPLSDPRSLSVQRINTFYGSFQVHSDVSISVAAGSIVCLLGGNASGKSTMMKAILGLLRPKSGRILFGDVDLTALSTPEIVRRGVASVPEARRIFPGMTVRENLFMGAYVRSDHREVARDAEYVLELFPRLSDRLKQKGGTLSGGEQQMLAIARALMARPRLICMDEPTMGLSPLFVDQVLEHIVRVNCEGISVFMVEQNADLALAVAHRGYVLQAGRIVLEGPAAELRRNPQIREAYLGQ